MMKAAKITIMHKIVYNGTMIPCIYVGLNNTHNFGGKKLLVKNSIIACDAKKIRMGILLYLHLQSVSLLIQVESC